jgi:hypothetical protein
MAVGRPKLPDLERRKPITVWLTPGELYRVCEAAQVNQQTASAFIRDAIDSAAFECMEPFPDDERERQSQP